MGIAIDKSVAMKGGMVERKRDAGALDHASDGINIKFRSHQLPLRVADM